MLPNPPLPPSRRAALRALGGAGLVAGFGVRAAPRPLRIRFSHVVAEDTPKGLTALRFQSLVLQRSQGQITVVVDPAARLYGDRHEFQALQTGAVEMLAPSLSKFGRVGFPEFELFDLPFLFNHPDEVRRVTRGEVGQALLQGLRRQGLFGLGYLDNGFKHMSANRPLHRVADYKGLRLRVQGSRVIAVQMRALGAHPVTLPFSVTREALAKGIVDGTENPLSNFWTQGMHQVQPHLSLTRHGYIGYAVITSQRFWASLDADTRSLLQTAMDDALAFGNRIAGTQNDKALAALRAFPGTAIFEPAPAQREQLIRTVEPAYTELNQRIGAHWMRDIRAAIGR